jgi:hypothetical protein
MSNRLMDFTKAGNKDFVLRTMEEVQTYRALA